jgi:hypothetical protein
MPSVDGELGFQGGATFYQDGKVAVDVRRYFETDAQGVPDRWWGPRLDNLRRDSSRAEIGMGYTRTPQASRPPPTPCDPDHP